MVAKMKCIFELKQISKAFPGVLALDKVDFALRSGEVHVLLGENGAGKSTLIKIMTGAFQHDSGEIYFDGEKTKISDPIHAQRLGISAVYQEFNLIPHLDAAMNIFVRKQPMKGKLIKYMNKQEMYQKSEQILSDLGVKIDIRLPVKHLSVAYQQMVEIAKALIWDAKVVIFDEPTAVITEEESHQLFKVINRLKKRGVAIVYISHRLEEIYEIGDKVTILRDGKFIDMIDLNKNKVDVDTIISKMVGRALDEKFPKIKVAHADEILRVEHISCGDKFQDVSFSLRKGQILGIAGLVGAGRTEVAKAIFGADPITDGEIFFEGKKVKIKSPLQAIRLGISLAPEDRKTEGLVQILSIKDNMIMANQERFIRNGVFLKKKIYQECADMVNKMQIATSDIYKQVKQLSGGNQQKVVLAKWLIANSKVVIFDEPTRGIDVGAKIEVYQLMNELVANGVAIIMISSELPEILGMSDRIIVLKEGRLTAELDINEATQDKILKHAT